MSTEIAVSGKVLVIGTEQHYGETFFKRELVIETDEKYPQQLAIEFIKDNGQKLDIINVNDFVTVSVNLRGREHGGRYYVSLAGWKIASIAGGSPLVSDEDTPPPRVHQVLDSAPPRVGQPPLVLHERLLVDG